MQTAASNPFFRLRTAILMLCFLSALSSCDFRGSRRVRGNGELSEHSRNIESFRHLAAEGPIEVQVTEGDSYGVVVNTDENLQQYIDIKNEGEQLKIRVRRGYRLKPTKFIRVQVTAPGFGTLKMTGNGSLRSTNTIRGSRLEVILTGSGNANLSLDAPEVEANITGSGNMDLHGTTRNFSAKVTGSGDLKAFDLLSEETSIRVMGSGDADVFGSKKVSVHIAGSGDVRYRGPATVKTTVNGSGSVARAD